jgi:chorismate mutase/prephenate dehydratase
MAVKDADMSTVKEVISHPQALAQCADFISSHSLQKKEFENTAMAAQYVAEKGDTSLAAIASEETAELYGLKILQSGINESAVNTTRFAVVSRACTDDGKNADKHTILMFTVRNEAGSLARAIYMIGSHGYNMRCLRSRPMKELLWQYYFYVELEGSVENENGKSMLRDLQTFCDKLKVLGTFHSPKDIS